MTEAAGGAPGRPPDLLFCRKCGGSIARRELLAGRARLLEDRAYCAACAPGSLAARRALRGVLLGGGIAAAAFLGAAVAVLSRSGAEAADAAREARAAAAEAQRQVAALARRVEALEAEARGLAGLVEAAGRGADAARAEGRAASEATEDRLEGAERSLGIVLDTLEALRREVVALRGSERLTAEEEAALLDRLVDPNEGVRFEAMFTLRRGQGADARRAAAKGLDDPQGSVRTQAAALAGALRVAEARPGLVRCLSFPSAVVRDAAIEALRLLEGTDLGFDPLEPSEAKRAEAVHRWEERLAGR